MAAIPTTSAEGQRINYQPIADTAAGVVVSQGFMVGVTTSAILAGELGSIAVEGIFDLPKGATAFTAGAVVFWNTVTSLSVAVESEDTVRAGLATEAAATGDATVSVKLSQTTGGASTIEDVSGLQSALDAKAPIASPTFTGTVSGVTKSMVGLGNVDNTSDVNKPVSTAQAAADTATGVAAASDATTKADAAQAAAIQRLNHTGTQAISTVTGLQTALDGKSAIGHGHEGTAILSTGETGGSKFLREDGDGTCSWQAVAAGDAQTANPLSQFASTTSAQLAGVISDETGTGSLVFANSPTLVSPALGTPSAIVLTNATGFPTLNQNTTGSAATLTTPRTINGVAFDGSANITVTAAGSTLSDTVTIANGGTGATTAADARANLGLGTLATQSGTFSGTSSGTNTGDQTITLTGDVTGSGAGSFSATVVSASTSAAGKVELATTAEAIAGTDSDRAVTPSAMMASRRGSGRAWFWEAFNDFAFAFSGNNTGSDGFIFGAQTSGTAAEVTLGSYSPYHFSGRSNAGIATIKTGTDATGLAGVDSWNSVTIHRFDTGTTVFEGLLYIDTLADATNDYVLRLGYTAGNTLPSENVCFEYNRANSVNWHGVCSTDNNFTRVDTGVAVTAAKWIIVKIVFTHTLATFYVNGTSVGTITTNIRADGSMKLGAHIIKTAGTTSRYFLLDYLYYRHDWTSERTFTP